MNLTDKKRIRSDIARTVLENYEDVLVRPINKEWLMDYTAAGVLLMGWALDTLIIEEAGK